MPEPEKISDVDFDTQLRGLFQEAELVIEGRSAGDKRMEERRICAERDLAERMEEISTDENLHDGKNEPTKFSPTEESTKASPPVTPSQALRPLLLGLEALTRAAGESTAILQRLDKTAVDSGSVQRSLPKVVADLQGLVDQKNRVNQRMFDALHEELKGYKDGFLLESVHRPIIRDLITLYDDLAELQRQMGSALTAGVESALEAADAMMGRMRTMELNMEHHLDFILEVLARLQVTQLPIGQGKLDKRTQRVISVELSDDPEEDTLVIRTSKRGFMWKDRVIRAEEVVVKKWKEGASATQTLASQK